MRAPVSRIRRRAVSPLRTSPVGAGWGPPFCRLAGPVPGPVVLKSGRNRRYRPVASTVGRAVTNRVSGPRPSGHFPAPTSGPRRSTVSPRPPGGSRSGPRGPVKALSRPPPLPARPPPFSAQVLRRGNPALSRGFPFAVPAANRLPHRDVRAFLDLLGAACRDGSARRDFAQPLSSPSLLPPPPPPGRRPSLSGGETRSRRRAMRRQRSRVDGDEGEKEGVERTRGEGERGEKEEETRRMRR